MLIVQVLVGNLNEDQGDDPGPGLLSFPPQLEK